jgi:hypothetical protein
VRQRETPTRTGITTRVERKEKQESLAGEAQRETPTTGAAEEMGGGKESRSKQVIGLGSWGKSRREDTMGLASVEKRRQR